MDENCIFCRIVNGELGTEFVAESERAVAFDDIKPVAPVHVLVVPKRHVTGFANWTIRAGGRAARSGDEGCRSARIARHRLSRRDERRRSRRADGLASALPCAGGPEACDRTGLNLRIEDFER